MYRTILYCITDIEKLHEDIGELTSNIESTFVTKELFDMFVAQYDSKTEDIVSTLNSITLNSINFE